MTKAEREKLREVLRLFQEDDGNSGAYDRAMKMLAEMVGVTDGLPQDIKAMTTDELVKSLAKEPA